MPDDYMNTVSQLERHLTGDHIGSILECKDVFTANQRILDCLIVQLDNKEDTFDLCNWLSAITDAPLLTVAIEDLKIGTFIFICIRILCGGKFGSARSANLGACLIFIWWRPKI